MIRLLLADCRAVLATLPAESVQCVVTSPPYWGLRDYGVDGQLGLEPTPELYVQHLAFDPVRQRTMPRGTRVRTPTRNSRTVWTIPTRPYAKAHFATFPPALVEPCLLAGSRPGDTVLDPFAGAGTVGLVAERLGRDAVLIELNPVYAEMARRRITEEAPLLVKLAGDTT